MELFWNPEVWECPREGGHVDLGVGGLHLWNGGEDPGQIIWGGQRGKAGGVTTIDNSLISGGQGVHRS